MDKNTLKPDAEKGKKILEILLEKSKDLCKERLMPEDLLPKGVEEGSKEHILFLTLTLGIDYLRDANKLWNASREAFEDPQTNYLFDSQTLSQTPVEKVKEDLKRKGMPLRFSDKDSKIWKTLGQTFYEEWDGNPFNLFKKYEYDAHKIWEMIQKNKSKYPSLSGHKIGSLWIRMLRDNAKIKLTNLEKVPIPVDIHVARATLTTGILRGYFNGYLDSLYREIRKIWFEITKDLYLNNKRVIPLDLDISLWCLSRDWCSENRDKEGMCKIYEKCFLKDFCVKGKVLIKGSRAEINTVSD